MTRLAPALLLAGAALAAAGCMADLSEPSEIDKLRILAIRADPPEVTVDPTRPARSDDPTSVASALVVGQEGELSYAWSLCLVPGPLVAGETCYDPELSVSLGTGETAEVPSLEDAIALLLASLDDLGDLDVDVDLEEGVDVRLVLEVADRVDGAEVARQTAVGPLRVSTSAEPNRNPSVCSVEVEGGPEACDPADGCDPCAPARDPWPDTQRLRVAQGQEVVLTPVVPSDAQETYADGEETATEELLYSWYATDGSFEKQRSSDTTPDNAWTSPQLDPDEAERLVTLWLVVRDDRGGVGWLTRQIRITRDGEP